MFNSDIKSLKQPLMNQVELVKKESVKEAVNFEFEYTNIPLAKAKKDQKHAGRKILSGKLDTKLPNNSISTSKYNFVTFLPKNLIEQFSKIANVYFLVIGIMQCIKEISVSGGTPDIFAPLAVIIAITALKDLYEDIKRHRSDSEENNKTCMTYNAETLVLERKCWHQLRVGHIIKIHKDEYIPADIFLLQSSDPKSQAFIETKNLDGETNLKHKSVPKPISKLFKGTNDEFNVRSQIVLEFEAPNPYLYIFNGTAKTKEGAKIPLDSNHFVLRGCSVRNTDWVYGLVTYTGSESKIMMNSVKPRAKKSKVERLMNTQVIIVFCFQIVLCIFCAIWYSTWFESNDDFLSYLDILAGYKDTSYAYNFGTRLGSWILIFQNFVPISLLVTLEMVKFLQGTLITKDKYMIHKPTNTPTVVQSSNLNEELGQIEYIFSDKTGTLTQNYMEFRKLISKGVPYGITSDMSDISAFPQVTNVNFRDSQFFDDMKRGDNGIDDYLISLAVCHTIITEVKDGEIVYNAASPDELALANFAKYAGCAYIGLDEENHMEVSYKGKTLKYKLLQVLEFNSKRKRMSVIVENQKGEVILYTKGADSIILERINKEKNPDTVVTMKYLSEFADEGLRTLLIASRKMTKNQYESWAQKYLDAATSHENKQEKMEALQDEIEVDLSIIGATAIEDKLQDEVGPTIAFLKRCGIKVWVLTGDKIETAINIGFSCNLLTKELKRLIVDGKGKEEIEKSIAEAQQKVEKRKTEFTGDLKLALIVSGDALIECLKDPLSAELMKIADVCEAVICCRVAPKQKADVVTLVRKTKPKVSTLAIGDGANDVNMITAAHVGVGIRGVEGQQAARASDYAFGEFKFLKRLLCYHGRESYRRNSLLILYNFWKNILLVMPVFWLGFSMAFSGQQIYETWLYSLFNVFYAALPIVIYALVDKQYPNKNKCLMEFPQLYLPGIRSKHFNTKKFWLWMLNAFYQSVVVGWFCILALERNFPTNDGYQVDIWISGTMIFGLVVVISNLKILTFSYSETPVTLFVVWGSIILYVISVAIVNAMTSSELYNDFADLFHIPNLYWGSLEIIACTTFFDLAIERYQHIKEMKKFRRMTKEHAKHKYEEEMKLIDERKINEEKETDQADNSVRTKRREISSPLGSKNNDVPLQRRNSKTYPHSGYAFSQEEKVGWYLKRQGLAHPQN